MARRKRSNVTVSLFPFLSILACVIGTLTLMITALALGQMDSKTVSDAERFVRLRSDVEERARRVEDLKTELKNQADAARVARNALTEFEEELQRLLREKELLLQKAGEDPSRTGETIDVDEDAHQRQLDELQEEIAQLEESIDELQSEADEKNVEQETPVLIRPSGSGRGSEPTFVECRAGEIVLLDRDPVLRIRTGDLETNPEFAALLKEIASNPNRIVIFLVREDSYGSYTKARDVAQANYAKNGKLPIVGQGRIDLRLFGLD